MKESIREDLMNSDQDCNTIPASRPHSRRAVLSGGAALIGATCLPWRALAQNPSTVRLVVGYTAGGGVDAAARILVQAFQPTLAPTVIVDNRPGAGSTLGARVVSEAPPDGAMGLLATSSNIAIAPAVYKNLPYDPRKDLTAVGLVTVNASVLAVNKALPVKTMQEFVAYCKANPDKISFGSSGVGTGPHLQGQRLAQLMGVPAQHIPYRGGAQALTDLVGGRFDYTIDFLGLYMPQIVSGGVRALAVISDKRIPSLPDVPTMAEAGMPQMDAGSWNGIFLPPKTPRPIVDRWAAAIKHAQADPNVVNKLNAQGSQIASMNPDDFTAFVAKEVDRWKELVSLAGMKPI
jgi:tripartite-type tricarboxylate transporter receptor subunit TctC